MVKLTADVALASLILAGCLSYPQARQNVPILLPTSEEVAVWVGAHWPEFQERFGRFTNRVGQHPALVSVGAVSCSSFFTEFAACAYTVTARYPQADEVSRKLQSQFERRSDGALNEVIVAYHERRRR